MLASYLTEHCVIDPNAIVPVVDVLGSIRMHCRKAGLPVPTRAEVVEALEKAGFAIGQYRDRAAVLGLRFQSPPRFRLEGERIIKTT